MAAGLSEFTTLPSPEWSFSHWVPQLKTTSHLEWILFLKIAARDKTVHIFKLQPTPPVNINKSYANIWGHESPELIFICCWTSPHTNFRCSMWGNLTKGNMELCILVQRPFSSWPVCQPSPSWSIPWGPGPAVPKLFLVREPFRRHFSLRNPNSISDFLLSIIIKNSQLLSSTPIAWEFCII